MAKIINKSNYRVVVEPKIFPYSFRRKSHEEMAAEEKKICNDIMEQIKRHVDDVERCYIEFDTEDVCSHCGDEWEVDEQGEPQCCNKAVEEYSQGKVANA